MNEQFCILWSVPFNCETVWMAALSFKGSVKAPTIKVPTQCFRLTRIRKPSYPSADKSNALSWSFPTNNYPEIQKSQQIIVEYDPEIYLQIEKHRFTPRYILWGIVCEITPTISWYKLDIHCLWPLPPQPMIFRREIQSTSPEDTS